MVPKASRRKIILLSSAGMGQHGILLLLMGPVLPRLMSTFEIQESTAGLILGIGSLGFMTAAFVAGRVVDRYGVRLALLTGWAFEGIFLLSLGFSPFLVWVFASHFFLKFGAGFIETSLNVMPTLVEKKRTGSLMNLVHLFFSAGALVAPILAGLVLQSTGSWRPVFWLAAVFPVSLVLAVWWSTRLTLLASPHRETAGASSGVVKTAILKDRSIVLGGLVLFLYVGAEVGVSNWIVLYMERYLGFSTITAASGLSFLWIGLLIGRYLNSLLARALSSRQLVLAAGVGGLATGLALLTARTPLMAYLWLAAVGLFMSGVFPNVMAELNGRDPSRSGAITGFLAVASAAGAGFFQPILGIVAQTLGLPAAIAVPAFLMAASSAAYLGVDVRSGRRRVATDRG
jgi:fucose permease